MSPEKEQIEKRNQVKDAVASTIEVNQSRNLIVVRYRGHVGPREVEHYLEEARLILPNVQPGFRLLVDLTNLTSMDPSCAPSIRKIMDLLNEKGITMVVRVIPNPALDIGLQIMSLFHYGEDVRIVTCATLEEATSVLAD